MGEAIAQLHCHPKWNDLVKGCRLRSHYSSLPHPNKGEMNGESIACHWLLLSGAVSRPTVIPWSKGCSTIHDSTLSARGRATSAWDRKCRGAVVRERTGQSFCVVTFIVIEGEGDCVYELLCLGCLITNPHLNPPPPLSLSLANQC